jgi:hypothetical protein
MKVEITLPVYVRTLNLKSNITSCVIFWVVLRRMVFNSRRFGTLCLFHLHRRVDALGFEDGTDTVFRNVGY